jgi:membrane protease YdiL (CAAX protease family)
LSPQLDSLSRIAIQTGKPTLHYERRFPKMRPEVLPMLDKIAQQRLAPLWLLFLFAAAWLAILLPANFWFGQSRIWVPWREGTYGLVWPALIVGLICMLVVVGLVLVAIGRFRPSELGLELAKLPEAIAYTLVIWIVMQILSVVLLLWDGQTPQFAADVNWPRAGYLLGELLAQLAGNALCEEVLFRGFLFVQCGVLFARWAPNRPALSLVAAGLVSSVVFAVAHLPHRLGIGGGYANWAALGMDQGWLVVWGCVYCWLYVRTGNLWFVGGVHSLANARTMLVTAPDFANYLPLSQMLGVGLALVWDHLPGHDRQGQTGGQSAPDHYR